MPGVRGLHGRFECFERAAITNVAQPCPIAMQAPERDVIMARMVKAWLLVHDREFARLVVKKTRKLANWPSQRDREAAGEEPT